MRQPGGTGGTATATTAQPPATVVQSAPEHDAGYGYGAGLPTLTDLIATGAIPPTPQITENARRLQQAADGTLPIEPWLVREGDLGPAEPGHTRVPRGISMWGDAELLTDVLLETIDAVVRDGQIRNVDLSDPKAARTVRMVLENVVWRARDVVRWRTLGCVDEDADGAAWVRPAPAAAIALFLGLIPESVCRRAGHTYRDRPDLAPPGVAKLDVEGDGRVSGFGLWRRQGALPPPDPALRSPQAHQLATFMLTRLKLGEMRVFAGYKPKTLRVTPGGQVFEDPFREPNFLGGGGAGADYPDTPTYTGRSTGEDVLTTRIMQVIAARLDDLVDWMTFGAVVDGELLRPPPPEWMASMLLIGPRAREAYALQRGRRELSRTFGRYRADRIGNFPLHRDEDGPPTA